jgi:acyl-CoA thioesterase
VSAFTDETAIEPDGAGRWRCRLTGAWNIGDTPNGGYALIPVLRALRELGGHPDPVSVTVHFVRPCTADADGVIEGRTVRSGRGVGTATATLTQDGTERLLAVAAFGRVRPGDGAAVSGPERDPAPSRGAGGPQLSPPPPDHLPPPDACVRRDGATQGVALPIASRLDIRLHPDHADGQAPRAELRGWIRFADGAPADTMAVPLFADAFPPALFSRFGRVGWVPTVELTVHVRHAPVGGWIQAEFSCDDLADGRMIETGTLWDEAGTMVARSRQLGLLLTR